MDHLHPPAASNRNNNNNVDFVDAKPPRITRSSLDTRQSSSANANRGGSGSGNSQHRTTNIIKSHSPSPSISSTNQRNNSGNSSGNNNNNESSFNQSSSQQQQQQRGHRRVSRESNYMPQKRTDSSMSYNNKQRNSFLDSDSDEASNDHNNHNASSGRSSATLNNKNGNSASSKQRADVNSFLDNDDGDSRVVAKCIFNVDGKSADVEIDNKRISWKYISTALDDIPNSRSRPTSSSRRSKKEPASFIFEIPYDRMFSIEPKRVKSSPVAKNFEERFSLSDEYTIDGFIVHVFERSKPNSYLHRCVTFSHPHRQTCKQWISYLYERANAFLVEKRLLILLNPFSGEKRTRSILNFVVTPIIELVNFDKEIVEFHDQQSLHDVFNEMRINFNDYYGILLLCGDGSISGAVRDIIERQARNDDIDGEVMDLNKITLKTPLCILPAGTTNAIANTIYGTGNPYVPLMHLVYGTYINIDITSMYTSDHQFYNFAFGYSCGFGSDIVRYFDRYSRFGVKKMQASLARGAAKKKHKPIELEIKYLPSTSNQPCDKIRCHRGCSLCDIKEKSLHIGKTVDEVQEFDPLAVSINEIEDNLGDTYRRDSYDENSQDWKTVCGTFMHVSLLSNAMLWDVTSGGLSKYGHIGDGYMDLILVDAVSRKDFYRFLKRHTNKKNQLELPFVKAIRIKEAKIKIKNHGLVSGVGTPLMQSMSYNENTSASTSSSRSSRHMSHFGNNNSPKKKSNISTKHTDMVTYELSESDTENEIEDFINKNFGNNPNSNNNDDDDDDYNGGRPPTASTRYDRRMSAGSSFNEKRKGPLLYYIKKDHENNNENVDQNETLRGDNLDNSRSSELPSKSSKSSHKRSNSLVRSSQFLLQKSKSIMNLFQSEEKKNRSSATSSSRNEKLQKSSKFKTPYSWNIDFNLCPMPYLHIRCHKQYLPVFGHGVDEDTEIEDTSITGCFP